MNVAQPPAARYAGALSHFIREAITAARDADDALLRDVSTVTPTATGLEVVLGGQRLEVTIRPAQPGCLLR